MYGYGQTDMMNRRFEAFRPKLLPRKEVYMVTNSEGRSYPKPVMFRQRMDPITGDIKNVPEIPSKWVLGSKVSDLVQDAELLKVARQALRDIAEGSGQVSSRVSDEMLQDKEKFREVFASLLQRRARDALIAIGPEDRDDHEHEDLIQVRAAR